jgi:aminoglycoside phosphotransferase (APT) family kinase protein
LTTGVVHNDLQHANILINKAKPYFLDLEDLCLGSPNLAAAHCIFKLLRHAVFGGARLGDMQAAADKLPALLCAHRCWSADQSSLRAHMAYRIWADIDLICQVHLKGNSSYLYDLEKKICNLFELDLLLGESKWT